MYLPYIVCSLTFIYVLTKQSSILAHLCIHLLLGHGTSNIIQPTHIDNVDRNNHEHTPVVSPAPHTAHTPSTIILCFFKTCHPVNVVPPFCTPLAIKQLATTTDEVAHCSGTAQVVGKACLYDIIVVV